MHWGTDDFSLARLRPAAAAPRCSPRVVSIGFAIGNVSWSRGQILAVPEPGTFALLALGLAGLLLFAAASSWRN